MESICLSGTIGHACVDQDPFVQRFSFKLLTKFEVNTLIQWIFYGKISCTLSSHKNPLFAQMVTVSI